MGRTAAQLKTTTRPDTTAAKKSAVVAVQYTEKNTGLHEPFRYRGPNGDEDERGAVAF